MRSALLGAALAAGCLGGPVSLGWGNAGHAQIAEVAWSRLSPEARGAVVRALERHPRFAEDFAAKMPDSTARGEGRERWIFLQASIWPDVARRFRDDPDPALRALNRSPWHYVNLPLSLTPDVADGDAGPPATRELPVCRARDDLDILQALRLAVCKLEDPGLGPGERALYLSWLLHLVGDAHQPLHAVSLYSEHTFPDGDRGGNAIRPAGVANLHAAWDGLAGPTGRRDRIGSRPTAEAVRLLLADDAFVEAGRRAARRGDFDLWLDESRDLARAYAYTGEVLAAVRATEGQRPRPAHVELPALSEAYLERAREIARRRIVEAGFRLAAIVERLFG